MSTRVAVDSVVWFSLADRAGAVERSIRISERSFSGWVVEPVFGSYESASDFARRASGVAGVGVVVRRCPAVAETGYFTFGLSFERRPFGIFDIGTGARIFAIRRNG